MSSQGPGTMSFVCQLAMALTASPRFYLELRKLFVIYRLFSEVLSVLVGVYEPLRSPTIPGCLFAHLRQDFVPRAFHRCCSLSGALAVYV